MLKGTRWESLDCNDVGNGGRSHVKNLAIGKEGERLVKCMTEMNKTLICFAGNLKLPFDLLVKEGGTYEFVEVKSFQKRRNEITGLSIKQLKLLREKGQFVLYLVFGAGSPKPIVKRKTNLHKMLLNEEIPLIVDLRYDEKKGNNPKKWNLKETRKGLYFVNLPEKSWELTDLELAVKIFRGQGARDVLLDGHKLTCTYGNEEFRAYVKRVD